MRRNLRRELLDRWYRATRRRACAACAAQTRSGETYCTVCGQELIERTRDKVQLDKY